MIMVAVIALGSLAFLIGVLVRSITRERRPGDRIWTNFSLSLWLLILFLSTWIGHGIADWQEFANEQEDHGRPAEVAGFMNHFAQSTLENWQSEFLQLFAFVVLASLYIHRGSAESRDSGDEILDRLRRIEEKLDSQS